MIISMAWLVSTASFNCKFFKASFSLHLPKRKENQCQSFSIRGGNAESRFISCQMPSQSWHVFLLIFSVLSEKLIDNDIVF